jgi:hypothetical protein
MPTAFGHGLAGPEGVGNSGYRVATAASPKGKQVNIPALRVWLDGNVYSVNEVGVLPQESYLFSLCLSRALEFSLGAKGFGQEESILFLGVLRACTSALVKVYNEPYQIL